MTLKDYVTLAFKNHPHCPECKRVFEEEDFGNRDHPAGYIVNGFAQRQWLFLQCSNGHCFYELSFIKLGIPRATIN